MTNVNQGCCNKFHLFLNFQKPNLVYLGRSYFFVQIMILGLCKFSSSLTEKSTD